MVLGELEAGFSLWERLRGIWDRKKSGKKETIAERFVQVFEHHGVCRNQIPRFFGHDLAIADVQSDEALMLKLNDALLDDACRLFNVRREWMDGASEKIHPTYFFYKSPRAFADFISTIQAANTGVRLGGCLVAPINSKYPDEAILIVEEKIGDIGDKEINRFYLCNDWSFSYWKARADLAACIAIAFRLDVYVRGVYVGRDYIERISEGKELLGWGDEGIWGVNGERWEPEYMLYDPDLYLKNIDAEDGFSSVAALERWLERAEEGLMQLDGMAEPCVEVFRGYLEKLKGGKN